MSAFTLHVITAVAFGLSAPAAALHAVVHFAAWEFWRAVTWTVLTATYATLAFAFAQRAIGA